MMRDNQIFSEVQIGPVQYLWVIEIDSFCQISAYLWQVIQKQKAFMELHIYVITVLDFYIVSSGSPWNSFLNTGLHLEQF